MCFPSPNYNKNVLYLNVVNTLKGNTHLEMSQSSLVRNEPHSSILKNCFGTASKVAAVLTHVDEHTSIQFRLVGLVSSSRKFIWL